MYIVALTGGIGSGKSEAAIQFAKLGVPIVDLDVIAHELTAAGNPFLRKIEHVFGELVFNEDNSLNRAKLRAQVLANPAERIKLEQLIHPTIYDQAIKQILLNEETQKPAYQLLVIPLLFESKRYHSIINKIIVVDCNEQLQIQRAMNRSQLNEDEVRGIMAAQASRTTRLKLADEVIDNSGSREDLITKVNKLHKKLIKTCIVSK
jgi:dephospho-CoA kinase